MTPYIPLHLTFDRLTDVIEKISGPWEAMESQDWQDASDFRRIIADWPVLTLGYDVEDEQQLREELDWTQTVEKLIGVLEPDHEPWAELEPIQREFLERFMDTFSPLEAAKGFCHVALHHRWLRESPAYAEAVDVVRQMMQDDLESLGLRLAMLGEPMPVLYRGLPVLDNEGKAIINYRPSRRLTKFLISRLDRTVEKTRTAPTP